METQKVVHSNCSVCGMPYENWVGSTPCCGGIAYAQDEHGNRTSSFQLFGSINGGEIKPLTITPQP